MPETDPQGSSPPPTGPPPAPPGLGEPPGGDPDPSDPGPPIVVMLDDLGLGDLGNAVVDARLLQAILLRDGTVARWLRSVGVDLGSVEAAFPGTGWPIHDEHDPSSDAHWSENRPS